MFALCISDSLTDNRMGGVSIISGSLVGSAGCLSCSSVTLGMSMIASYHAKFKVSTS